MFNRLTMIREMKKLLFLLLFVYFGVAQAQNWQEIDKESPLTMAYSNFGYSVAVDGNYTVVGAIGENNESGSAFVYFFNGTNWVQQAKLTASDAAAYDNFGFSVSISGDYIVVGAHFDDDGGANSGSAYVFEKPAAGWSNMTQTAKLTASDAGLNDEFGRSVSISADHIVVGAYLNDENGSAYVFKKPVTGWTDMTQTAKLIPSDIEFYDNFGYSVSISGDYIVVGSILDYEGGINSGSAYVFEKPVAGWINMTQTAKLTASDASSGDQFGKSVSISGDLIVVGASFDDDGGTNAGSAYVFEKPLTGWTNMTQTAKLNASDPSAFVDFGSSVSISSNYIVVGAYYDNEGGPSAGSAYIFEKPSAGWSNMTQTVKLIASDAANGDYFGISVGISGDHIVVGACSDDNGVADSGSAYFYFNCQAASSTDTRTECNSYTWIDGITYNVSNNSATHTLTNAAGCDSIVTLNLTINSVTNNTTTLSGETITATNSNATYQWLDCDNNYAEINGETNQTFTPSVNGNYAVELTENGCVDTSDCVTITSVGLTESDFANGLKVYPNPTAGDFTIDLGEQYDKAKIVVKDIAGRIIRSQQIVEAKIVNLSIDSPAGIYFLLIQAGNKRTVLRLVKE